MDGERMPDELPAEPPGPPAGPEPPWKPVAFAALRHRDQYRQSEKHLVDQVLQMDIDLAVARHELAAALERIAELEAIVAGGPRNDLEQTFDQAQRREEEFNGGTC